jgi:uncharacterized MAPEG superfamily protein
MFDVLIIFLIFYLLQLMLPMLLSIKSVPFSDFAGARDKSIDLSLYSQRADRSVRNFRESLPVVLMLIALSIALDIDNSQTVMYFIYTRIAYTLVYILAIPHLRTLIWFLSLWFIAQMVVNLI